MEEYMANLLQIRMPNLFIQTILKKVIINRNQQIISSLYEIGGKVIILTSVCLLSVSDHPNVVQLNPQLRKAAGTIRLNAAEITLH